MTGIIEGGWAFVWGAYGASWAILIGYAFSIHRRYRDERRRSRKGG